jgi:uncharacterized protein (UPF0332 family)
VRQEILALARHRLARAHEAMADGEILLAQGSLNSAANRFYYAAFYAARALLANKEVDSSRHSGVIALFQKHFVKPGTIDTQIAKALPRAFEKRQASDYGDFAVLTKAEVERMHLESHAFVDVCAEVLRHLASAPDEPGQQA